MSGGLVALGVVLAAIGYVASGFDPNVFSAQIDIPEGTVTLSGTVVEDPSALPLIRQIAGLGGVDVAAPAAPTAPTTPTAP